MKWRALAVAVAGMSAALWACSFQNEWDKYCTYPGRCAQFEDAGPGAFIEIAQGTVNRRILLAGQHLEGATVTLAPEDAGMVSVDPADGGLLLDVSVKHGIGVGTQLQVRFHWQRTDDDQESIPLVVTAITAKETGNDDGGAGTPTNPYRSLLRASQHSDTGDTIKLGLGTFPSSICTALKPGVTVEGVPDVPDSGSVVQGSGLPGTCGFTLSDPAQALRFITISNFPVGLRATATTGAPTAFQVTVQNCDVGVAVLPGGMLLLQESSLHDNGAGLVSDAGNVVVDGGTIALSARNGVLMTGAGGTLSLAGATVNNNATGITDDLAGAGVLITSAGGTATLGSNITSNGHTAVTVSGTSNRVTFDGATLRSPFNGSVALVLRDPSAAVFMRNTTFQGSPVGLRVDGFASFNGGTGDGGTGDGGYGHNSFACVDTNPAYLEIWDTRTSSGPEMSFGDTAVHNVHMDAGVDISSSSPALGIQIDGPNPIHFH